METKKCPVCNGIVKGRIDKKFCSSTCRSAFQYEQKLETDKLYLRVDKQLKINRKVLKKYNLIGKTTLRREVLHNEGFDPNFFTHYRKMGNNEVYFYCYDFGFKKTNDNAKEKYLIINWNGV